MVGGARSGVVPERFMVNPAKGGSKGAQSVDRGRFFADRRLWRFLAERVLPAVAGRRAEARLWCAAAAGGEAAYSLALLWATGAGTCDRPVRILATDACPDRLERTRRAVYDGRALRGVSAAVRERFFRPVERGHELCEPVRGLVHVARHDLGCDPWPRQLDLILLGKPIFAGADEARQREVLAQAEAALASHSWLIVGAGETFVAASDRFVAEEPGIPAYRRRQ
jgi:chemotaxis methyl-accepting protein methylase